MAKYNHLPFEDWLFSEQPLTDKETTDLQDHLKGCESCRQLSEAWTGVEAQLKDAPVVAPAPGFSQRWQARLAVDMQKRYRKQVAVVLSTGLLMVVLVSFFLAIMALPLIQNPRPYILTMVYRYTVILSSISYTATAVTRILRTLFDIIPPTLWVGITLALGSLGLLWVISLRKLSINRRVVR